ncbi:hypothetical protein U5A82_17515 [Sphingobium sp. CR2-8]|nr:hypothetical protein [Sphingobium sp. CR2-8]MEC3912208.1 hypothetical protein [Sphingobium sp. CR2-8]
MPEVICLDDRALVALWNQVEDPENLTEYQKQIIAEMEAREIDF